jgi:hypothetical protein
MSGKLLLGTHDHILLPQGSGNRAMSQTDAANFRFLRPIADLTENT